MRNRYWLQVLRWINSVQSVKYHHKSKRIWRKTDHFKRINSSRIKLVDSKKRRYQRMMLHEFTLLTTLLHQLLKGTVTYLVCWLKQLIKKSITVARKKKDIRHKISSASETTQLNHQFCSISAFAELKIFQRYSSIKQWTEVNWKAIVHQIVLMIASLLAHDVFAAVHFTWAVVNFVVLTQYISHDKNTLQYLLHVLFWINKLKNVFQHLCSVNLNISEEHFNILKLHVMTHYAQHIRQYGSADNIDTEHSEAAHKFLVKAFFSQTNKHKSFQQQLLLHNTCHLNLTAMKDLILWKKMQNSVIKKNLMIALMTQSSQAILLCRISGLPLRQKRKWVWHEGLDFCQWCFVLTLNTALDILGFLDALAAFVRNCRNKADEINSTNNDLNWRSKDSSSVASYYMCVHESLKCWKQSKKNIQNLERLIEERVYCILNWQRREGLWRHDCVLIQKRSEDTETALSMLNNWLPDRLQIIISVADSLQENDWGKSIQYIGALVDLFKSMNKGCSHGIHNIIELSDWSAHVFNNLWFIEDQRFYTMSTVLQSVHIISASLKKRQRIKGAMYYLNNFIDWDSYNSIYEKDFLTKGTNVALYYSCER